MEFDLFGLIISFSDALDNIENEFVGIRKDHAKRVCWLSLLMGKKASFTREQLYDLAFLALMHDNGLTMANNEEPDLLKHGLDPKGIHCQIGEENVQKFPLMAKEEDGILLYHHERADGLGPFKKKENEIPLMAKIIHVADFADNSVSLGKNSSKANYLSMLPYVNKEAGRNFSPEAAELFHKAIGLKELFYLSNKDIHQEIRKIMPQESVDISNKELKDIATVFGNIVDSKSPFTKTHSAGIADKAVKMGQYYGWDLDTRYALFFAGSLHDIGKMLIPNSILEKPGKLTSEEYERMKLHVYYTYQMLKDVEGLQTINSWASNHHERLDGSGYPWGKTAEQLGTMERLLACMDVYQALREDRPYRKGLSHQTSISLMEDMAENGKLDRDIIADINKVFAIEKI